MQRHTPIGRILPLATLAAITATASFAILTGACGDDGREQTGSATAATAATGVTGVTSVTSITGVTSVTGDATLTAGDTEPTTGATTGATHNSGTDDGTGSGSGCLGDADCPPGEHCTIFSGACVAENGCLVDEDCDGGFTCVGGACEVGGCGAESFNLTAVPPNVLIVLDRSGSMDGAVQDSNKTRWEVAKEAIGQLVNTFNEDIRFGLDTYSSCIPGQECSAGSIVVPIGNLNAGPITGFLDGKDLDYLCNSGDPETSTGNTLFALIGEPTLQDPQRSNVVLLITDGGENNECQKDTNGADAAGKLLAQALSVKTFVVGFSDDVIDSLAGIAEAGGTMTPYNANNPASLELALTSIAGAVASCQFLLDTVPDDANKIFVFFDDDPAGVPRDGNNGWTHDPVTNTITFHGPACDAIKNGTVKDVDVVFGCNVPVPG